MPQSLSEFCKKSLPALTLMALAFLLYANTFDNAWTFDDFPVIVENPDVRSLANFFKDSYPGRPLRELSFVLDHALFGFAPAGWHIQQVFWHGLNAILLFLLVARLGGGRLFAWLAALIFLAHPIQVEVVASLSHRKDSLCLAFVLLALHAWINLLRTAGRRWPWALAAVCCWGLALLAKQIAVGLPLLLLAWEWLFVAPEERLLLRRRPGLVLAVLAVAGVIAGVAAFTFLGGPAGFAEAIKGPLVKMGHYGAMDAHIYYLVAFKALGFLGLRFFWPDDLAVEYVFDLPESYASPWVLATLAAIAACVLLAVLCRRRAPVVTFGLLWMALFWLPVSNLFWPLSYFAADRYLYTVSLGLCLIVAWALARLAQGRELAGLVVGLVLVAALGALTWKQNDVWQSTVSLYGQAAQVSPDSTQALLGLGIGHMKEGDYQKAHDAILKATLNFNETLPLYYLALVKERLGDTQGALRDYLRFVQMNDPRWPKQQAAARQHLWLKYRIPPQ